MPSGAPAPHPLIPPLKPGRTSSRTRRAGMGKNPNERIGPDRARGQDGPDKAGADGRMASANHAGRTGRGGPSLTKRALRNGPSLMYGCRNHAPASSLPERQETYPNRIKMNSGNHSESKMPRCLQMLCHFRGLFGCSVFAWLGVEACLWFHSRSRMC